MKKSTLFIIALLATVLTFNQCKKSDVKPVATGNGPHITLAADYGQKSEKTGFDPATHNFVWTNGATEYIYVGGSEHTGCLGVLSGTGNGENSMTFSGDLTVTPEEGETLHFFYLGKGRDGSVVSTLDFSNQDGTLGNVTNFHIAVGDGIYTSGTVNYATTLDMKMAIAYFDVSGFKNASDLSETVYLQGTDLYCAANVDYHTGTITGNTIGYIKIGTASSEKYVALIPSTTPETAAPTTLKFDSDSKTGSMVFLRGIQEAKYYAHSGSALNVSSESPVNGVKGLYSVSTTKKVRFAKGNLQYQASTSTWRFAEHQYDFVGDASDGNVYIGEEKCNNRSISSTYNGWIDLFGWGAWGTDGTPYSTSGTGTDYSWSEFGGSVDSYKDWYTLSIGEWSYLIKTRFNASNKYGTATVAGVYGLIILPDNWTGVAITSGIGASNIYTIDQWNDMEAAGATFLPVNKCWRNGSTFYNDNSCRYWHSSPGDNNGNAYYWYLGLYQGGTSLVDKKDSRSYGLSVRLVR